jgi:hypothetical protein
MLLDHRPSRPTAAPGRAERQAPTQRETGDANGEAERISVIASAEEQCHRPVRANRREASV